MRSIYVLLVFAAACPADPPPPSMDAGSGMDASGCVDDGDRCDADGNGCTRDVCESGVCVVGNPRGCDDGDSCTADSCESTGPMTFECTNEISVRSCTIDGNCVAEGTMNPDNACEVCDAALSENGWSFSTAMCDDEDACTTNDSCVAGVCVGTAPNDDFESNNTSAEASVLEATTDGTDYPQGTIEALLFPVDDVDFFRFEDTDTFGAFLYPKVELRDVPEGSDYDLCAFVSCVDGSDDGEATCRTGTAARFEDMSGCCSNQEGASDEEVYISPNCGGSDDSVNVLVRVRRVDGDAVCGMPYRLVYGDD